MSNESRLYVSVEGPTGQLVISGPLILFRELMGSFAQADRAANPPELDERSHPDTGAASPERRPVEAVR